jgi:hypothetical protein
MWTMKRSMAEIGTISSTVGGSALQTRQNLNRLVEQLKTSE